MSASGAQEQTGTGGAAETLPAGVVIAGRFELVGLRGRGGMGSVYEAEDTNIGRRVALKLLAVPDPAAAQRFALEAKAASRISSRHAAPIYDFGEDPQHGHYMVMELLEGGTLDDLLEARGSLTPSEAAAVGADIAEALSAAHAASVVHRDLKPGNVMVLEEGGVKVVDFGIARMLERSERRGDDASDVFGTDPGVIVGTPIYISPEAVLGDPVGPPADLYSLGIILFELVTGRPPFVDDVSAALCTMHVREPPPTIADLCPDIELPDGYEAMVAALLEKDPDLRPRSAREVASSLRAMSDVDAPIRFSVTPALSAGASTAYLPSPAIRSEAGPPWRVLVIVALAILGATAGVTVAVLASRSETAAPPPAVVAEPTPPPAPAPAPPAAPVGVDPPPAPLPPSTIELHVSTRPANTALRLDGELARSPITLPNDGAEHTLEISARGHRTERRTLVAEGRDLHLEVVLARSARARRRGEALPAKLREW